MTEECDLPSKTSESMLLEPVDEKSVSYALKNLKNSGSIGVDEINTKVLKECSDSIAAPLVHLINLMMVQGVYPEVLKLTKIVPILKKGDPAMVENYRPIALLSVISKVVERILFDKIILSLNKHKIIHCAQHGFLRGKSTTTAIYDFMRELYDSVDSNMKTLGIFMDLSKTFDLVGHQLLLEKLNSYGLRGKINDLLRTYSTDRSQIVKIDGVRLDLKITELVSCRVLCWDHCCFYFLLMISQI